MRFMLKPAPGYWFLWDFPSKKFGTVYISAGHFEGGRWFLSANNGWFGQLPGSLYIGVSWGRNGLRFSKVWEPDEAGVAECLGWMKQ